ncbi:hypothetical protein HLVA_21730 (plasmid) [Haliovirga abyssi]|uniref:Uncharacterized protein TP-0789 domain-containing protein n=2 Tax=Haliovirga abyssi TaxID=2996794 RepID=A0AAU9D6J8_9FUSO|nr:hypothetical protein HLVA_21730 [Haliovirga abyssi]
MKIKKSILILFFIVINLTMLAETPIEIINKSRDVIKLNGVEMIISLITKDRNNNVRKQKIASISKLYSDNTEKKIMRFLYPTDVKGTGFLSYDYEKKDDLMWLYLPSLRKSRKIAASERSKSFMGSEFSYSDITSFKIEDFKYSILGEENINGEKCWKLEQKSKNDDIADDYGFFKKIVYISKRNYMVMKTESYDEDDELCKVMEALGIKKIDVKRNRYRATHLIIKNLDNGRSSEMIIEKIKLRENIKDSYFTTRFLERN